MNKHTIISVLGLIILCSCGHKNDDYFTLESKIINEKINYNLRGIEKNYMLNPQMAAPFFEIASFLKISFDSILILAEQADLKGVNKGLTDLHSIVKSDSYFDSDFIQDIVIPNRFNHLLDNNKKSNLPAKPEILRLDILNLEHELLNYIFNSIQDDYYKFNKLEAIVIDSSNNIKVGETYHANIFLAAYDTTVYPSIMVTDLSQPDNVLFLNKPDNERLFELEVIDGRGIYKEKVYTPGTHGFKGVVNIRNSNGEIEKFMFYNEFTVRK